MYALTVTIRILADSMAIWWRVSGNLVVSQTTNQNKLDNNSTIQQFHKEASRGGKS